MQFAPIPLAPASTIAAATASGVASNKKKDAITGNPVLLAATTAILASAMSLIVSSTKASAPAAASVSACAAKAACAVGDVPNGLPIGPMEANTSARPAAARFEI